MLHVLLLILKIVGIVLLCILGVFLLLILLVLFVPVRYRAEGEAYENLQVKANVTWLLHIISVTFCYKEGETDFQMRIFGIRRKPGNVRKNNTIHKKRKIRESSDQINNFEEKPEDNDIDHRVENISKAENDGNEERGDGKQEFPKKESQTDGIAEEKTQEGKWERMKLFIHNVINGFKNIRYTITNICDKINKIRNDINRYYEIFSSDYAKNSYSLCGKQIARLFRHIRPRKFSADIHFGTGDPASTGELIGVFSMFYPKFRGNVSVTPDFERAVFEGRFLMKGRVYTNVLLRIGWILFFDKDLRRMMSVLRKEDEDDR